MKSENMSKICQFLKWFTTVIMIIILCLLWTDKQGVIKQILYSLLWLSAAVDVLANSYLAGSTKRKIVWVLFIILLLGAVLVWVL